MLDIVMPCVYDGVFYGIQACMASPLKYIGKYSGNHVLVSEQYNTSKGFEAYSILLLDGELSVKRCILFNNVSQQYYYYTRNATILDNKLYYTFGYKKADSYKHVIIGYTDLSNMSHTLREISIADFAGVLFNHTVITDGIYIYYIVSGTYGMWIIKADKDFNILKVRYIRSQTTGSIWLGSIFYYNGYIVFTFPKKLDSTYGSQVVVLDTDLDLVSSYIVYINAPHAGEVYRHTDSYAVYGDLIYVNSGTKFTYGETIYEPILTINRDTFAPEHIVKIYSSSRDFTRTFIAGIDNKIFYAPVNGYESGGYEFVQGGICFLDPTKPSINIKYFPPLIFASDIVKDGVKYIIPGFAFNYMAVYTASKSLDIGNNCIAEYDTGVVEKATVSYSDAFSDIIVSDKGYSLSVPPIQILDVTDEVLTIRGCTEFYEYIGGP